MPRPVARISFELTESETRLKLAVARHAWKDAVAYAEACCALEAELVEARANPAPNGPPGAS